MLLVSLAFLSACGGGGSAGAAGGSGEVDGEALGRNNTSTTTPSITVQVDASTLKVDVAAGVKTQLTNLGVNSAYIMDSQLASAKIDGRHLVTFGETGSFIGESTSPYPEQFNGTAVYSNYDVNAMLRRGNESLYATAQCLPMDGNATLRYVSGGRWITSIQAVPGSSTHAIAIYHREYDWCKPPLGGNKLDYDAYVPNVNRSPEAYTTGLLYTEDGGRNWIDRGNILTGGRDLVQDQYLGTPGASGILGQDGYMYVLYYDYGGQSGDDLRIARSVDRVTPQNISTLQFRKRAGNDTVFSASAMGSSLAKGTGTGWLEKLSGLAWSSKNNTPHVHWNTGISRYVLTYKNWSQSPSGNLVTLKVAFSTNLLDWTDSQDLLRIVNPAGNHVYASIIGDSSSTAGAKATIYFNAGTRHQMNRVDVTFGVGDPSLSTPGVFDAQNLDGPIAKP
jgi:hypothetical protein